MAYLCSKWMTAVPPAPPERAILNWWIGMSKNGDSILRAWRVKADMIGCNQLLNKSLESSDISESIIIAKTKCAQKKADRGKDGFEWGW